MLALFWPLAARCRETRAFLYSEGAPPLSRLQIAVRIPVAFHIVSVFLGSCRLYQVRSESGGFRSVSFILVKIEGRLQICQQRLKRRREASLLSGSV